MPRGELCPADCLFASDENEGKAFQQMCDVDCKHSRDVVLENPILIQIYKWRNLWQQAQIIATNDNEVYIKEQSGTIFARNKNSDLIKK